MKQIILYHIIPIRNVYTFSVYSVYIKHLYMGTDQYIKIMKMMIY